jgi:hypothetical protein
MYSDDNDFKLRGGPSMRADVAHNVFGHSEDGALEQTVTANAIVQWDNIFGLNTMNEAGWGLAGRPARTRCRAARLAWRRRRGSSTSCAERAAPQPLTRCYARIARSSTE